MNRHYWRLFGIALLVGAMLYGVVRYFTVEAGEVDAVGPGVVAMVALLILLAPRVPVRGGGREILKAVALWGGLAVVLVLAYQWREPVMAAVRPLIGAG